MRSMVALGVLVLTVLTVLAFADGRAVLAQRPLERLKVNPKVLAFLKPVEIGPKDSELEKLLKERHNTAVKLLEVRVEEYKKGIRDMGPVFEAARLTADAKLDLATDAKTRVAALEQILEVAQIVEQHLKQQVDKGFGFQGDYQRSRLGRLTVQIELIKANELIKAKQK